MGGVVVDNGVTPGHARVGKREDNDNYFLDSVNEVLIYDRALSAEEGCPAGRPTPRHAPF
jgi:hypothetical protein